MKKTDNKKPTAIVRKEIFDNIKQVENDAINNNKDIDINDTHINNNISDISNTGNINRNSLEKQVYKNETEKNEVPINKNPIQETLFEEVQQTNEPKNEDKKETRGRKKGVKNKSKVDLSVYENVNSDAPVLTNSKTISTENNTPSINLNNYISGTLLLIMIDILFPTLMKMFFTKLKKLKNKKALNLTSEERKELEPLADEFIKSLSMTLHPAEAFLIVLSFMYASKYASLEDSDFL